MKFFVLPALIFSLTLNLFADEAANLPAALDFTYKNLREAKSDLISDAKQNAIDDQYRGNKVDMDKLHAIITDRSINRCATKVVAKIKEELDVSKTSEVELAILALRSDESIDDIAAGILMKANDLDKPIANPIAKDELSSDEEDQALDIYQTKAKDLTNKSLCAEDTYRDLVGSLASKAPKFYRNLKHINKIAFDNDVIGEAAFKRMELMRTNKVHEWPLTLSMYAQRLESINKTFNTRQKQASKMVTNVKFRQKISMRQSLYERYNSTQIILLANIIKGLKTRLESTDVTININYPDRPTEVISLSPMEKFRFILKLLRKELSTINNSTLLDGRPASYMDLITASYEVGYINANEMDQLVSLQEIWNPQKTPKEKMMFWVKTFGGIASVFLPPPFGFVAVMAIMLIDQQVQDAPVNQDPDYNLF